MAQHYIAKFDNEEQVSAALTKGELLTPYVVTVGSGNTVHYSTDAEPYHPYSVSAVVTTSSEILPSREPSDWGSIGIDVYCTAPYFIYYVNGKQIEYSTEPDTYNVMVPENFSPNPSTVELRLDYALSDGTVNDDGEYEDYTIVSSSTYTYPQAGWGQYADGVIETTAASQVAKILYNDTQLSYIDAVEIDGELIKAFNIATDERYVSGGSWTFANAGEHTVRVFAHSTSSDFNVFFRECDYKSIVLGGGFTGLVNWALAYSTKLESVSSLSAVTSLGNKAFQGDTALTSIDFIDNLIDIGNNAFRQTAIESVVFGSGLTTMGYNAFNTCPNLSSISFSAVTQLTSLESIGDNLVSLESIEFPDCISEYGQTGLTYAFISGATNLESVKFGSGTTEFKGLTITGCPSLTSITCTSQNCPSIVTGAFGDLSANTGTLYVKTGADYSDWMQELGSNWTLVRID